MTAVSINVPASSLFQSGIYSPEKESAFDVAINKAVESVFGFAQNYDVSSSLNKAQLKIFSNPPAPRFTETSAEANRPKLNPRPKDFDAYFHEFKRTARAETLEYGLISGCDRLVERWSHDENLDFGGVINTIFLKALGNKLLQLALLKSVSSIGYESVRPHAPLQAMAALVVSDLEVAEAGIRAFENWGHKDGIDILTHVKMSADWLEDYRRETILYLKGLQVAAD
jgi:hypothetical protein